MGAFAAGAMLLWGGVAAVPILLHLLRRRRQHSMSWGAMRFLQAAVVQRARKFQLWRLLLLLLRVLAVFMIAVALARPFMQGASESTSAEVLSQRLIVLVVDASHSMKARVTTRDSAPTRLQVATESAQAIVDQSRTGDAFLLVAMGERPIALIGQPSYQREVVRSELGGIVASDGEAQVLEAMTAVSDLMDQTLERGWAGPIEVLVFTDMQASTWDSVAPPLFLSSAARSAVTAEPFSDKGSSPTITSYLVNCADEAAETNVIVRPPQVSTAGPMNPTGMVSVTSALAHLGRLEPLSGISIRLEVDGRVVESTSVASLQPGETVNLNWNVRLAPGQHLLAVRAEVDDLLSQDNESYAIFDKTDALRVALIGSGGAATRYVNLALSPQDTSEFRPSLLGWEQLARVEVGRFDIWVLCDPPPLTRNQSKRLSEHLLDGGGVVWLLGPQWRTNTGFGLPRTESSRATGPLEGTLLSPSNSEALLAAIENLDANAWIATQTVATEGGTLDPLGYESPPIAPFEPYPAVGLLTLPIFRSWNITLGSNWKPALRITPTEASSPSSIPLMATWQGQSAGRQILVGTPGSPGDQAQPWNAIIAWPVFVPLIQETVRWTGGSAQQQTSIVVGELLQGLVADEQFREAVQTPSGATIRSRIASRSARHISWEAGTAPEAGVYRWGDDAREQPYAAAVVFAPAEGDLVPAAVAPEGWQVVPHSDIVSRRNATQNTATQSNLPNADPESSRAGSEAQQDATATKAANGEISWWMLLVSIVLLTLETSLVRFLEVAF